MGEGQLLLRAKRYLMQDHNMLHENLISGRIYLIMPSHLNDCTPRKRVPKDMEKLRVLIAEDEDLMRELLRTNLEKMGHIVVAEATDGRQAVSLAMQHKPDAVLMDIKMPSMDGIEAAKEIVQSEPTAILFLTSFNEDELIELAGEAGAVAYLMKPFRREELAAALEVAVRRFRDLQAKDREIESLQEALETRKLLERAKGILMRRHRMSEEEAYKRIHFQARNNNRKIKEIAQSIITAADLL